LAPDYGFPTGGACGSIDYDGSFTFGIYPELLIFHHQSREWWEIGNLSSQIRKTKPSANFTLGTWRDSLPRDEFIKPSKRSKNTSQLEIFTKSISPAASAQNVALKKGSFFCTINFVTHLLLPPLLISILLAEKFSHHLPRLFFASPALKSRPDQSKGHGHALLTQNLILDPPSIYSDQKRSELN
jgi:hypothetical protein